MTNGIYDVIEPEFRHLIQRNARLKTVATGLDWAEGPAWFPALQVLVFSDIPADRMLMLTSDGQVSTFRRGAGHANGNTRDREGRLVTCHHGTRSVTRTEHDGRITVLADRHAGGRLNSPNDVVVHSDGSIWFTDPTYGILSDYEGHVAPSEQASRNVYRVDPASGAVEAMITDFVQPNGLAFSPDETVLYVAESGSSHDPDVPAVIRAFDIDVNGRPARGRDFAMIAPGLPDGFRVDDAGRVWTSAGDGVHCFAKDGQLLGRIAVPEVVSNLCFGGERGNRLFITATSSVYSVPVNARAAA